jgi:hypothetical protein
MVGMEANFNHNRFSGCEFVPAGRQGAARNDWRCRQRKAADGFAVGPSRQRANNARRASQDRPSVIAGLEAQRQALLSCLRSHCSSIVSIHTISP